MRQNQQQAVYWLKHGDPLLAANASWQALTIAEFGFAQLASCTNSERAANAALADTVQAALEGLLGSSSAQPTELPFPAAHPARADLTRIASGGELLIPAGRGTSRHVFMSWLKRAAHARWQPPPAAYVYARLSAAVSAARLVRLAYRREEPIRALARCGQILLLPFLRDEDLALSDDDRWTLARYHLGFGGGESALAAVYDAALEAAVIAGAEDPVMSMLTLAEARRRRLADVTCAVLCGAMPGLAYQEHGFGWRVMGTMLMAFVIWACCAVTRFTALETLAARRREVRRQCLEGAALHYVQLLTGAILPVAGDEYAEVASGKRWFCYSTSNYCAALNAEGGAHRNVAFARFVNDFSPADSGPRCS
jgi:hypothetical protein